MELLYNGAAGLNEHGFKNINTLTNKNEHNLEGEMDLINEMWHLIDGFNREVNSYNDVSAEEMYTNMDI